MISGHRLGYAAKVYLMVLNGAPTAPGFIHFEGFFKLLLFELHFQNPFLKVLQDLKILCAFRDSFYYQLPLFA